MFAIHCLCYKCTKNINCYSKVTVANQEAVKKISYRGIVQPRQVVPRFVVPGNNSLEQNGRVNTRHTLKSNYQNAFTDEFWPDMWYFVSMSIFFLKLYL